jgi:hypothetical protein
VVAVPAPASSSQADDVAGAVRGAFAHVERERMLGYDPYDALASPLFALRMLRSSRRVRFASQQLLKRAPLNVRPLLGIRKGYNPVTVALVAQAYAYRAAAGDDDAGLAAAALVPELARLRSPGWSGDCWGYDFDWAARRVEIPAWTPTVVATGIVTNALHTVWRVTGDNEALALCRGAVAFVREDLNRVEDNRGDLSWSYSPLDREVVLNASLKGARLLAQVNGACPDDALLHDAVASARFVVAAQRADGSWPYALGDERTWVDHYHTGYVLDCLEEIGSATGDEPIKAAAARGFNYYRRALFSEGGVPKFRSDRLYPVDATCCAQALLTLCRFGEIDGAERCARWALPRLQNDDGSFAYQVHRRYTNRIPYMRWSTAWMLVGLSRLLLARAGL